MTISFTPFLLLSFFFQVLSIAWVSGQCLNDQKSLLLQFNNTLIYNSTLATKLTNWNENLDCCNWDGVQCDIFGHVTGLQLDDQSISGGIDSSSALFSLYYLENLNLAYNSFDGIQIPKHIRYLTNLVHLNLSDTGFGQEIPFELSEITSLVTLDLSWSYSLRLSNTSLKNFVMNLRNLEVLYLNGVIISDQGDWWEALSLSLPKLRKLSLRGCNVTSSLTLSNTQLQSLSVLRLDWNNLSTTDLDFFGNFKNLTVLTLSDCSLQGSFPPSILHLPTLQYLDLSYNYLLTGSIPEFQQGSSLTTLVLSETNFSGSLPHSITNLSMLSMIDLSSCNFTGAIPSSIGSLSELVHLDFSYNFFTGPLPHSITNLSMLSMIDLSSCNFTGAIPSSIGSLSELVHLDFSYNFFTGPVPVFIMSKKITYINLNGNGLNGSLTSAHFKALLNLLYLDLGYNSLTGSIPSSILGLRSLQNLLLSNNKFNGQVIDFSTLNSALEWLDLRGNQLGGSIPESFFNFRKLNVLLLSFNSFNGTMELGKFQSLPNLTILELGYNNLTISSTADLSLFPQLESLDLADCNLYKFPNLINQSRLTSLDLSNNNISGDIPSWLWKIGNGMLTVLNISCNSLVNMQTPYQIPSTMRVLDLHSNELQGELPFPPPFPVYLDYSSNNFQGTIPIDIGRNFTSLTSFFSVASNNLTGEIPTFLCSEFNLRFLDLSGNSLTGSIPNCLFQNLTFLKILNLGRNNIDGVIPDTFSVNCGLRTLDLRRNSLRGTIPNSLANCKLLEIINVGSNNINDRFPCILKNLSSLQILILRSNKLFGNINCFKVNQRWSNLQIIDLASNLFTGNIYPRTIASWSGMKHANSPQLRQNQLNYDFLELNGFLYRDTVTLTMKRLELEFSKILADLTCIDFSGNNFDGMIPDTIGELSLLYVLNLSRNSFTSKIPDSITNLKQLSSIDLSRNQLTGEIPSGLTSLTFLSVFDVSYNKLFGRIPFGSQFWTFPALSYEGNTGLCGFPLSRSCNLNETTDKMEASVSRTDLNWLFIVTCLGYCTGSALITMILIFSKKWREKCEEQQYKLIKFICHGYGSRR